MVDPLMGQELGGYRITRLLKRTGMSIVYLARDEKLQRDVVVKIMLPSHGGDETFAARFQQEALATARLAHPNIVHIYDFGQREDLSYMVMEFLAGGSLADRLAVAAREGRRLDPIQSQHAIYQIALALDHAHRAGIVHRDVKPGNILFSGDGNPVLTDLGIAKAREGPRLTKTLTSVGTPEYMSPEQGRGDPVDGRSDIYSLGVVLYELLAGVLPFQADTSWGIIYKHMQEPPPPIQGYNPAISPALRSVIEKALAKRPEDRFQTGREFAEAILRAQEAPARRLYPTPPPVSAAPSPRNTPSPARRTSTPSRNTPAPSRNTPAPTVVSSSVRNTPLPGAADAVTRVEPGGPVMANNWPSAMHTPRPAAHEAPRAKSVWFLGGAGAVLVLALVFVFSGVLRPRDRENVVSITAIPQTMAIIALTDTPVPPSTSTRAAMVTVVPSATPQVPPSVTPLPPTATQAPATATRVEPSATPLPPTATPEPATATSAPATVTPTTTPRPTLAATATRPPTPVPPSVPLLVPVLVSPAPDEAHSGQTTFTWRWSGPALTENQGFEVRLWKEEQPDHFGAAEPVNGTSIVIDVSAAYGVAQGGSGTYFWTVAVVQRNPYQRIGQEAAPRRLLIQVEGGEVRPEPTHKPPQP